MGPTITCRFWKMICWANFVILELWVFPYVPSLSTSSTEEEFQIKSQVAQITGGQGVNSNATSVTLHPTGQVLWRNILNNYDNASAYPYHLIVRIVTGIGCDGFHSEVGRPCFQFKSLLKILPAMHWNLCFRHTPGDSPEFSSELHFQRISHFLSPRVTRGVSWGGAEVLIAPRGRIFDLWVTEKFAYKYPSICTKLYHQTFLVILHSKIWLQFLIIFFQDEVLVLQLAECWISEMWTCSLRGVVCLCGGGEVKLWI